MYFLVAALLSVVIYTPVHAAQSTLDCGQTGRSIGRLEADILAASRTVEHLSVLLTEVDVELMEAQPTDDTFDAVVSKYDTIFLRLAGARFQLEDLEKALTFWRGRYIQECKAGFNTQDYPGPRKIRARNMG